MSILDEIYKYNTNIMNNMRIEHKTPLSKEELLQLDEVKEILKKHRSFIANYGHNLNVDDFIESQLPKKEYEILSFTDTRNKACLYKVVNGICKWSSDRDDFTINELLNDPLMDIYSIKRLSDQETFTIGDKVQYTKTAFQFTIEKFYLDTLNNHLLCSDTNGNEHINITKINKITKRIPLFTTEDNVKVFEGDKVYMLNTKINPLSHSSLDWNPEETVTLTEKHREIKFHTLVTSIKYFSTKEAAEQYILMNKPILTLKEVEEIVNDGFNNAYIMTRLKNRTINKLKE